jgi:hypothetical protein
MASFTDTKLQPFTPYVDQLPVAAMVEVGRIKQNQYEQGVQKIQAQIDNIAGMDVVRDVDKQYLQSKLNQLSGNLKMVAAGDFSNYQLVNSVGGMITKIGKDPNIQNAVSSTVRYKKALTDMETAKKEGKSSPSNEWDFMNQANEWLNSTDIKQGFRGGYNPYTNYKKNALEAIKSLTGDSTITDDAFTIDAKGNLVVADANVRRKFAGISPDKIQQALMGVLTPADFKQMEIDGRYTYSNVDPKRFVQDINSSYTDKISFYNQQKRTLQNAKDSTTSNVEKTKLDEQIATLNKVTDKISSEYRGMASMISSGNVEGLKAQLHTSNFIDNFSKAFSYTETSQTYEGTTPQETMMWRASKEQDWKKFIMDMGWDREKFRFTSQQDWTKFIMSYDLDKQRLGIEREKLSQKEREMKGLGSVEGLPQGIPQSELPRYTLGKVVVDTENAEVQIAKSDADFLNLPQNRGKDEQWLEAQRKAWKERPNDVDPMVAEHFVGSEENRRTVDANKVMIGQIRQEGIDKFGDIKALIPKDPAIKYFSPEGSTFTYTPEDFVNANENITKYIVVGGPGSSESTENYDFERARQELSPKELHLFMIQTGRAPKTQANQTLLERAKHYNEIVNVPYKATTEAINKYTADEVTKRITISQGKSYGFSTGKAEETSIMGTKLLQFINKAKTLDGGLANSPDFDLSIAEKLSIDPKANYTMTLAEGTQFQPPMYKINVTGEDGSVEFRVTPEEKALMFGEEFEAPPAVQAFRPYQEQIRKMGGSTTALSPGPSNSENSYLGKVDFPSVEIYGVRANIEKSPTGKYSIKISAYDPIQKKWFDNISYPRKQLVGEDQVIPLMARLNDAAVFELINERPPTAEELKMIQQASKKPF